MDTQRTPQIPAQNSNSGKIVTIIILCCIISAGIAGAVVYFWQSSKTIPQNAAVQEKIPATEKNTNAAIPQTDNNPSILPTSGDISKPTEKNPDLKACPPNLKTPIVHFVPGGLFTEAEKTEIKKEIINPYYDYMKDSNQEEPVVIAVNKYSDVERAQKGYYYAIDSYGQNVNSGWLERKNNENIDWWIPDCMNGCQFSASYRQNYPEVVNKYNNSPH